MKSSINTTLLTVEQGVNTFVAKVNDMEHDKTYKEINKELKFINKNVELQGKAITELTTNLSCTNCPKTSATTPSPSTPSSSSGSYSSVAALNSGSITTSH